MAGPPLGTQLGAMGINIAAFVKDFNLRTSVFREGVPLPTRTTVNADRSYNLTIHHPTSVYFLKQVRVARMVDDLNLGTCRQLVWQEVLSILAER